MVNFQIPLPGLARTFDSLTEAEKQFIEYFTLIDAYSARFRPPIPEEASHPFRLIPATDSGGSRPPIPEHSGHPLS